MAKPLQFSILYGHSAELVAEWCGVSVRTAKRWKSGTKNPPPTALKLFLLHRDGRVLSAKWRGWVVREDCIVDPEGCATNRKQLQHFYLCMQYAGEIAREKGPDAYEHFQRLMA